MSLVQDIGYQLNPTNVFTGYSQMAGENERHAAIGPQVSGVRVHVEAGYTDGLRRMIELWTRMGVVVKRPGPVGLAGVPSKLYVEVQRGPMDIAQPAKQTKT
ncbi:MAG TPA: hypothetical protein DEO64_17180 [Alcaligenes faecalis]|nr:hypothetical protein [Alcaligenes faecalis]